MISLTCKEEREGSAELSGERARYDELTQWRKKNENVVKNENRQTKVSLDTGKKKNEGFDVGGGVGDDDPIGPLAAAAFVRALAGPRLPTASAGGPISTPTERGRVEGRGLGEQGEQFDVECSALSTFPQRRRWQADDKSRRLVVLVFLLLLLLPPRRLRLGL